MKSYVLALVSCVILVGCLSPGLQRREDMARKRVVSLSQALERAEGVRLDALSEGDSEAAAAASETVAEIEDELRVSEAELSEAEALAQEERRSQVFDWVNLALVAVGGFFGVGSVGGMGVRKTA